MTAMSDLEETMQFDPDEGIADLDTHLDRLKDAAEAQGFNSSNAGGATLGDKFRGKLDKLKPKEQQ